LTENDAMLLRNFDALAGLTAAGDSLLLRGTLK
jgi:hypothetical protein